MAGEQKYPTYGLYFRRYAPFDTFGIHLSKATSAVALLRL
jgi:hypothetical protein